MKLGIIGDVHLGSSYSLGTKNQDKGVNSRLTDLESTLISTITSIAEAGCKQLIFTGDIFEHRAPSVKQQEVFSRCLRIALNLGIEEIHIVVGNHDQQRVTRATTISYIKELHLPNIHVYDEIDMVTIYDNLGKAAVNLLLMPFRDRKWFGADTAQQAINEIDEILTYNMGSIDNDAKKVLVGHMVIEDTMWMLDEYNELYDGNDLILPKSMFNGIDITVMGHIHTPGVVSESPFIYYSGSMEKRGAFEKHDKKYIIIDLEEESFKTFTEPCRPLHDIKMDFSQESHGENLMELITGFIENFSADQIMKDSIVRIMLTLSAEDDKFCIKKDIEKLLYDKYGIHHCPAIKPNLLFSRQSRDEEINEQGEDTESFAKFINRTYRDSDLKGDVLKLGLDIIQALEEE